MEAMTTHNSSARRSASIAATLLVALAMISTLFALAPAAEAGPLGGSTQQLVGRPCLFAVEWQQTDGHSAYIHNPTSLATLVDLPAPGAYTFQMLCNGDDGDVFYYLIETGWSFDIDESARAKNPGLPPMCRVCGVMVFDPQGMLTNGFEQIGEPVDWSQFVGIVHELGIGDYIEFNTFAELGFEGLVLNAIVTFDVERVINISMTAMEH